MTGQIRAPTSLTINQNRTRTQISVEAAAMLRKQNHHRRICCRCCGICLKIWGFVSSLVSVFVFNGEKHLSELNFSTRLWRFLQSVPFFIHFCVEAVFSQETCNQLEQQLGGGEEIGTGKRYLALARLKYRSFLGEGAKLQAALDWDWGGGGVK